MRDKFDNNWKDAFGDYERKPSSRVWEGISGELAELEAVKYKRQASFYKVAAAIAMFIASGLVVWNLYVMNDSASLSNQLFQQTDFNFKNPQKSGFVKLYGSTELQDDSSANNKKRRSVQSELLANPIDTIESDATQNKIYQVHSIEATSVNQQKIRGKHLTKVDRAAALLPEKDIKPEVEFFLAGVGLSTGLFDPNFSNQARPTISNIKQPFVSARVEDAEAGFASSTAENNRTVTEYAPSQLIAAHLKTGFRLYRRFSIVTGLAYGEYTAIVSSNAVYETDENRIVPLNSYSRQNVQNAFNNTGVVISNEGYETQNNFRLISIPVEINYSILEKRVFAQVKTGLQTNFNLGFTLRDQQRYFDKVRIESGEGSPYKNVNFQYLFGGVLGYRLQENYAITLEPAYAVSLNSFSKNDASFTSSPTTFMITGGLQFYF